MAADWDWSEDVRGRTVAYVSVDATGVPIQGENGIQAEGRMAWVGKVFAPKPEAKWSVLQIAVGFRRPLALR